MYQSVGYSRKPVLKNSEQPIDLREGEGDFGEGELNETIESITTLSDLNLLTDRFSVKKRKKKETRFSPISLNMKPAVQQILFIYYQSEIMQNCYNIIITVIMPWNAFQLVHS